MAIHRQREITTSPTAPALRKAELSDDFVTALTGLDARRASAVADRTRRVVLSSQGVLMEQKQGRSRTRSLAIAGTLVLLLLLAPSVWEAISMFIGGEHLLDPSSQLALWGTIGCAAMLAVALIAGRRRNRE